MPLMFLEIADTLSDRVEPRKELLMNPLAPQALKGIRVADLTWMLASAGTTELLASLGA
jgi:hypothetical protein